MDEDNYYIALNDSPIRFEPVSKLTDVFFDDCNEQVFAVRSGGATGVVVKGPDERRSLHFRMEDKGEVVSIKFSPNMKILAIQRNQSSVEFMNYDNGLDSVEYSQICKGKSTCILGFNWVNSNELVFITDHGVEYYQIFPEKKILKTLKAYSVAVNWFIWLADYSILLLSAGVLGNILHPFQYKSSTMTKMPKFEVELSSLPKPPQLSLMQRDVTMASIYGDLYIIVLRHQPKNTGITGAVIVLYQLQKEAAAKKTDILRLGMSGRFAINIVDNLVMVHHQASKTSMIFDIGLSGESDGFITFHYPVLSPLPIKSFKLKLPAVPGSNVLSNTQDYVCELYSPHWRVFQPNIVIDAKLGCLWNINIKLQPLISMISNKCRLIDFLLLRQDSKMVILNVCQLMIIPNEQVTLPVIARVFDKLNCVYWNFPTSNNQSSLDSSAHAKGKPWKTQAIIDQSLMYTHVFSIFDDNPHNMDDKFMVAILVEYIRSLNQFSIPVQQFLYRLVINIMVQYGRFYQLHQFLQYHVLSDSKELACLLLSLESVYSPAYQMALDMLKRLTTANEEIVEVLLSKQHILPALRFLRSVGAVDSVSARKFFEASKNAEDKMLFYTIFKFFEQRNMKLKNDPRFSVGEHCETYVNHFIDLFGKDALLAFSSNDAKS